MGHRKQGLSISHRTDPLPGDGQQIFIPHLIQELKVVSHHSQKVRIVLNTRKMVVGFLNMMRLLQLRMVKLYPPSEDFYGSMDEISNAFKDAQKKAHLMIIWI